MESNQTLMFSEKSVKETEAPCQMSQSWLVADQISWCLEVFLSGSSLHCGRSRLIPLIAQNPNGLLPDIFYDSQEISDCLAVPGPLPIEIKTTTTTIINPEFLHSELSWKRRKIQEAMSAYGLSLSGGRSAAPEALIVKRSS